MSSSPLKFEESRRVESLNECFFYHTIELPGFGLVRGQWDLRGRFEEYVGGVDVSNKSVLDVGTATGFLSFESERRGRRLARHERRAAADAASIQGQALLSRP